MQSLSAVASHQLWQSACSCGDGPRAAMESSVYHNIAVGLVHAMIGWFDACCKRPRRNGEGGAGGGVGASGGGSGKGEGGGGGGLGEGGGGGRGEGGGGERCAK